MGIRIHKVIGYGFTDVQCNEDDDINDDRFNLDGRWRKYDSVGIDDEEMLADFKNFLNNKLEKFEKEGKCSEEVCTRLDTIMLKDMEEEAKCPYDMYKIFASHVHAYEYGISSVFCVTSWSNEDWKRFDNIIDYTEETYLTKKGQENKVDLLEHGIYPYNYQYFNKKTLKALEKKDNDCLFPIFRALSAKKYTKKTKHTEQTKILENFAPFLEKIGTTPETFWEDIIPEVPSTIQKYCEFMEIFKDPKTKLTMRPMRYIYWS